MKLCDLCREQSGKGRSTKPHVSLRPVGEVKVVRGVMTGGSKSRITLRRLWR